MAEWQWRDKCRHCGKPVRQRTGGDWVHVDGPDNYSMCHVEPTWAQPLLRDWAVDGVYDET